MNYLVFDNQTNRMGMKPLPTFGSVYAYNASIAETAHNTVTTWKTKNILTVDLPQGAFRLSWRHKRKMSAANKNFRFQLLNGSNVITTTESRYLAVTEYQEGSGFVIVTLPSGNYTFLIQFQPESGTATISESYLEIMRVN